ncbi:heparinase [Pedobacter sp. KBW01]|uniref:alginate lyase family protein n=1 Tax=Pedobacter sp. KBW01 TaxID=2153364 RepID=UPI000F59397B|nr:alginate lyase family protein [Pedobacter sp. KBW01]RQO65733.1 heparinase [Pedobacter sp. KBW01]
MIAKLKKVVQLINNMGWRYIIFRAGFELKKRTGLLKSKFPTNPTPKTYYSLQSWKENQAKFFFESKETLAIDLPLSEKLKADYNKLDQYIYPFFSGLDFDLGKDYDWITNPSTEHKYNSKLHWLDINDYDPKVGDIKFVWEPSRFSHLYTIIRYDQRAGIDCSARVFSEIESWMDANPINQGPNYKCSQEISLRVMNWTFALYYYQNSENLTNELFERIQHYIYWQVEHVYQNINFSRIAVRNNHAITETLLLYLSGLLFPKFPTAAKWKTNGKKWFEQEIAYQIYEDGTFLQFSMNYHRVVVQLLTWAITISKNNGEQFAPVVYKRAESSFYFLINAIDIKSGWLPNYGANDGALFFKLSDHHYRDYRPQLEALCNALSLNWPLDKCEDRLWYGIKDTRNVDYVDIKMGVNAFKNGGYFSYRLEDSFAFIRCGNHKDRPSQADNLHFDLWHNGINLLHDGGSYKYNASSDVLKYFMGSASHNTVMLEDYDQMDKGARFIWYNWTQSESTSISEANDQFFFEGVIKAFLHLGENIKHKRTIIFHKNLKKWEIEDVIINKPAGLKMKQLWHTSYPELLHIEAHDDQYKNLVQQKEIGYNSIFYGQKEECSQLTFTTSGNVIKTIISIN